MSQFTSCAFLFLFLFIAGDLEAQKSDIIGETNPGEIRSSHRIFDIYTDRYEPEPEAIYFLSRIQDSVQIKVLFGSWCHDSKKQIPAFIKTIEEASNPLIEVTYYGMSRKKTDPQNMYERYGLKFTPTFIIYSGGSEIGRIVEEPTLSMEKDLVNILKPDSQSDR